MIFIGGISQGQKIVSEGLIRLCGSCGSYLGCFLGNLRLQFFERVVGLLRLLLAILSA